MATEKKPLDPEQVRKLEQAAAVATNEVIDPNLFDLLMNATEADLRGPDAASESARGTAMGSFCWLHAPAVLQLLAQAYRRLIRVAEWSGLAVKHVPKIHAKFIGDSKVILIRPAGENDHTAYDVHRYAGTSGAWVNLFDLIGSHSMAVPTGYRERYAVLYVPKGSPLWPGLLIDLGTPKERRQEPQKNKQSRSGQS